MNIKNVVIAIVLGVLILVFGVGIGVVYQGQKSPVAQVESQQNAQSASTIKALSSKVIPSVAAYGTITNINGRNLTVGYQTDSIVVPVNNDAKIYGFVVTSAVPKGGILPKTSTTSQQINFSDIKKGDSVSVNIKVLASGKMEGLSVIVLPPK